VPALTKCLADDSPEIRALAAEVLGKIGAPALTARAELSALTNDSEAGVRVAAIEALNRLSRSEPLSHN
jgi:HEAT repeat protein